MLRYVCISYYVMISNWIRIEPLGIAHQNIEMLGSGINVSGFWIMMALAYHVTAQRYNPDILLTRPTNFVQPLALPNNRRVCLCLKSDADETFIFG